MKRILAVAAAALAGLTACSVTTPVPAAPSAAPSPQEPGPTQSARSTGSAAGSAGPPSSSTAKDASAAKGAKEACVLFNSLVAGYAAVPPGHPEGYEDIYLQAEAAKDTVSGDLRGLFASLSLLAIDHSGSAASGGQPAQESQDAVRDAVFANAGTCTAAGVTLKL